MPKEYIESLGIESGRELMRVSQHMHFKFGPYHLTSYHFMQIGMYIANRIILMVYDSGMGTNAEYVPEEDTMYVGFRSVAQVAPAALMVHEATHAICDRFTQFHGINRTTSEALAYIAQAIYFDRVRPDQFLAGRCLQAGATVASWRDRSTGLIEAPTSTIEALRDAIKAEYSGKGDPMYARPNFNGIQNGRRPIPVF